jgi:hypothetical protein
VIGDIGDVGKWAVGIAPARVVDRLSGWVTVEELMVGSVDLRLNVSGGVMLRPQEIRVTVSRERTLAVADRLGAEGRGHTE